ncbi:hypothetical protein QBC36DRAFT_309489 [Triangularia setosa]|uniref:Amidoligase enzyme n=1 Tax=Triangularia setosa TaxID=2587417 RepID=A0AAN6WAB9_9PEZI|nr:hypothetical protein QBC36DRAFT_309489 [Podospora setosa]
MPYSLHDPQYSTSFYEITRPAFYMVSPLDFGIEIELLVSLHAYNTRPVFAKTLAADGWNSAIEGQLRPGLSTGTWVMILVNEIYVGELPGYCTTISHGFWPVFHLPSLPMTKTRRVTAPGGLISGRLELVSRVLFTMENWQEELRQIFAILSNNCRIRATNDCSMHIHVSPGPGIPTFDDSQIRAICKATSYFDHAITRGDAGRPEGNHVGKVKLPTRTPGQARYGLGKTRPIRQSEDQTILQPGPYPVFWPAWKLSDKVIWRAVHACMSYTDGDRARYLSWNFEIIIKQCGTLEFRRPPIADSAEKAGRWILADWKAVESKKHGGGVADLQAHVARGLQSLP